MTTRAKMGKYCIGYLPNCHFNNRIVAGQNIHISAHLVKCTIFLPLKKLSVFFPVKITKNLLFLINTLHQHVP